MVSCYALFLALLSVQIPTFVTLQANDKAVAIPMDSGVHSDSTSDASSLAKEQYLKAVAIRDRADATVKELKHAVKLLRQAAGVEHLGVDSAPVGGSGSGAEASNSTNGNRQGAALTADRVLLVLRNDTATYLPALRELMYMYRAGDGVPLNHAVAHRLLLKLAELGDGEGHTDLGFALALGVQPLGPNPRDQLLRFEDPDPAAALVHYVFGAQADDDVAQVILGYRHLQGLGVPKSCQTAVLYYAPVAERVLRMAQQREGLPQIRQLRLTHRTAHAKQRSAEQEVLHYQWFADFGNVDAARAVAHMLTHGSMRDYQQAMYYLRQAAAAGDADAMAHLGHIHANGIAVQQSNDTALAWFWKAAEKGHPSGLFGLGYMHLQGQGVARSYSKALKYFKQAVESNQGAWAGQGDAFYHLGLMHLNGWATKQDHLKAAQLFDLASKSGNLLASHSLAMLHLRGVTREKKQCEAAAALLKRVAEKGFPILQEANEDFQRGDYEWALLGYLKAAEMGMELGQSNAAWMLSEGYGYEGPGAGPVALALYKRAAEQGSVDALLRIGDGYWYGKGVARDWSRAAQMYNEAGKHSIGQALFNLGYMHEYGAGLPQDLHLAKRFYDRALEAQPEGRLAVRIALLGLQVHSWWEGVHHRLPHAWALLGDALFTVSEGAQAPGDLPQHHGAKRTLRDRLRDALTLSALFDRLDALLDLEDGVDVTIIGGLAALLLLVMWRRQTLRARQARFFPQVPPNGNIGGDAQQAQQPAQAAPGVGSGPWPRQRGEDARAGGGEERAGAARAASDAGPSQLRSHSPPRRVVAELWRQAEGGEVQRGERAAEGLRSDQGGVGGAATGGASADAGTGGSAVVAPAAVHAGTAASGVGGSEREEGEGARTLGDGGGGSGGGGQAAEGASEAQAGPGPAGTASPGAQ